MVMKRITCKAKTSRGLRCSRIALQDGFCSQHYKMMMGHKPTVKSPNAFSVAKVMAPTKGCSKGLIKRKGYVRRSFVRKDGNKVEGSTVKSKCIPDRGAYGRAWKLANRTMGIGKLQKGQLTKHGYSVKSAVSSRHAALRKAVAESGATSVVHKLTAVANYNKYKNPAMSRRFKQDEQFVSRVLARSK
jgi:hypothetical protein